MLSNIEHFHEEIEKKTFGIRKAIDVKMSKFYNGFTPQSPEIIQHRELIDCWHRIIRTKTNVLNSKTTIKRLAIILSEYSGHYSTVKEALENLKKAWEGYLAAKIKKEF